MRERGRCQPPDDTGLLGAALAGAMRTQSVTEWMVCTTRGHDTANHIDEKSVTRKKIGNFVVGTRSQRVMRAERLTLDYVPWRPRPR